MLLKMVSKVMRGMGKDEKVDMLDRMLEQLDAKLFGLQDLKHPASDAPERTPFTADVPAHEVSVAGLGVGQRMRMLPVMGPLMWNMWRSSNFYKEPYEARRSEVDQGWVEELSGLARGWGASELRFVKVPSRAVFQHLGVPHEYAIVFTVKMDKEKIDTAPSFECFLEVARGYRKLARISNKLTRWMRKGGVAAYPGTALGGLTDYSHIAELAGLGAIGYHGLLITPEDGALLRINTIYTNVMNLPIEEENPHGWIREFCSKCRKCIRKCPADAIFQQPKARSGGGMQCIDHGSCRDYFARHFGCAVCIKVCPFSIAGYEKIHAHFKGAPDAPIWNLLGEAQPREGADA